MVKFAKSLGELYGETYREKYYVDYCNDCRELNDTSLMCEHPYYCWNDGKTIQKLEFYLNLLKDSDNAIDKEIYKLLIDCKYEIVKHRTKEAYKEVR